MFKRNFIINNFYKFYKNFLNKKYKLKKNIKFLIKKKKNIIKKLFYKNLISKNIKLLKVYILKINKIYKFYINKINKILKLNFLKIPNISHYMVCSKNILIKKRIYIFNNKSSSCAFNYNFNIELSNEVIGKGFYYINPPISLIYNFLEFYIFNLHIKENNYKYLIVPQIINFKSLILSAQIPKFIKKLFILKIKNKIKYLIPTSEVSIVNYLFNKNLKSKFLPVKLVSKTSCFRNERVSYGLLNKNIFKRKQFDKIELINFVDNKNSDKYLIEMIKLVEKLLRNLKISYRIIKLSKIETGFTASITYDIEVWIPNLKSYCEISSCSNTGNYQATRLNIKYKELNSKTKEYVRIINGSGTAIGRLFVSLLQNYHKFKKINLPKFLKI